MELLYEEMQQESTSTHHEHSMMLARLDLADFRDAMGPDQISEPSKVWWGRERLPLHARLDETQGFRQIATTNYDEFLVGAAILQQSNP